MTRCRLALTIVATLVAGAIAAAQEPTQGWQRLYLEGIRLESERQWRPAMDRFERAASLRPEPQAGVLFGSIGRLDYDPYLHLARCALESDAPSFVVRRALERSARAGVTPRSELEPLAERLRRSGPAGRLADRTLQPTPTEPALPTPTAPPTATPEPTTGRLRFAELPGGAVVAIDGRALPFGADEADLEPGAHRVAVAVDGVARLDLEVELGAGETVTLVVPPASEVAAARTGTPTPTVRTAPSGTRALGVALAAAAAGAALLGVIAAVRAGRRRRALELTPTERLSDAPGANRRELGPYRLLERLGAGGMATTWRAVRSADAREVALKLPHEHCLDDPRFRARFLREGRLGSQLHHPNVVRLLEAGEADGQPYLAMELVHGRTLRDLLATAGALPVERALEVVRQVAEALDYAHTKGVVHRDLKPENLMTRPDGVLLVMDFGIARVEDAAGLTTTSVFMGTPTYAAPEAIAGEPCDGRQDLYALGLILYEMLAGSPPFTETTPLELLRRHVDGPPPDRARLGRTVPDSVWAVIERLTARRPGDRYPDAEALLLALHAVRKELEGAT